MSRLSLALAGDCMATRGALISSDPAAEGLRDVLRAADFAVANLELALDAGRGHPVLNAAGGGCLIAGPAALDEVAEAGFSVFGCANNHALDLGPEGLLGTIEALRARGLPFAGIGADLASARRPVYVDRPGGSLALISCSSTFLPGQEAAASSAEVSSRPGLNPLRHSATLQITADQMSVLQEIDVATGLRARRAEARTLLGFDPALLPGRLTLFGTRFELAAEPGFTTTCDSADLDAIAAWVAEARQRADVVLVSVHSHEPGEVPTQPAEFLREFAHRMIDEGADVVVGHGPHLLRGVELYRERPIFYSLGNIVSQIELADRIPAEDYEKVRAGERLTPARYFDELTGHGRRLFAPHRRYWQSLVPVLTFEDGRLTEVRLHAVELGYNQAVHRRGRPRLADPVEAEEILDQMAVLAREFGTSITVDDEIVGAVVLSEPAAAPVKVSPP